jgi:site-specific recombinase XerD
MGVDIHDVKEILGHHSVLMTERYLHAKRDRLRDAVAPLSGTTLAQSASSEISGAD